MAEGNPRPSSNPTSPQITAHSIPKRRELVKQAAAPPTAEQLKQSRADRLAHRWTVDPLTSRPLRSPIVSDCRGNLYNKDAVIEFLLPLDPDASSDAERARDEAARLLSGSVAGLRDVVEVHFTAGDAADGGSPDDAEAEEEAGEAGAGPRWVCPVSRERLRAAPAVYLVPCGHALAASVVRELDAAGGQLACPVCATPSESADVIPMLSSVEADVERLAGRIAALRAKGLAHSLKKMPGAGKKRKKKAAEEEVKAKPQKEERAKPEAGIKNTSTASLTARVLEEQEARNKKRKLQRNENLDSLFSSRDPSKPPSKRNDFLSRGFTMS
jgi:hypothetical protein